MTHRVFIVLGRKCERPVTRFKLYVLSRSLSTPHMYVRQAVLSNASFLEHTARASSADLLGAPKAISWFLRRCEGFFSFFNRVLLTRNPTIRIPSAVREGGGSFSRVLHPSIHSHATYHVPLPSPALCQCGGQLVQSPRRANPCWHPVYFGTLQCLGH